MKINMNDTLEVIVNEVENICGIHPFSDARHDYLWIAAEDGCVTEPRLHAFRDSWPSCYYIINKYPAAQQESMIKTLHWSVGDTVRKVIKDRGLVEFYIPGAATFSKPRKRRESNESETNKKRTRSSLPTYQIAERDGWKCHLCGGDIDKKRHGYGKPNWWGASADHVIPWSAGGSDDESNLRAAHWGCNVMRNNKQLPEAK